MSLDDLRVRLDAVDSKLLDLLRERAALAETVGHYKRNTGLPVYVPEREYEILGRIDRTDLGSFPPEAAKTIIREVISACRAIEELPRVAYLGPAGTFTEIAARKQFGSQVDLVPQADFAGIFEAVATGVTKFGVVPIENSTDGTIRDVLDLLARTRLTIVGETYVDVHHCLLSHGSIAQITRVFSKHTALEQCRIWLRTNLPHAERIAVASTAAGAEIAAGDPAAAAIAPSISAEVYNLPVRASNIEDRSDNRTRFFSLGFRMPEPTGNDKTSLLLALQHRPGALVEALAIMRDHELNLTMIESRPSPNATFEYLFFIDFEGHRDHPRVSAALDELGRVAVMTQVLGSYPRAS